MNAHLLVTRATLIPRTGRANNVGFPVSPEDIGSGKTGSKDALHRRVDGWCPWVSFDLLAFGAIYQPIAQLSEPYQGDRVLVLIGYARHTMHPARRMGMNARSRVADQSADSLRCLSSGVSEVQGLPSLSEFETHFEQELTPRLSENHAAGLQMDTTTGGGFAAVKEQPQLVAGDEHVLGGMVLEAPRLTV